MAELGNIDYTNLEAGVVSPSRGSEEVRALGQTLSAIGELHKEDVLGDYREEQNQIIKEHREEATTATVFEGASTLEGEAGEVQRRAKVLQAQLEQGNSSQRALAELEMKKLFNKYAETNRLLADELRKEFGLAVTMDTRLEEIGIIDSINKTNAQLAQGAYNDMVGHAHKKWEDGGLGIDPRLNPSDPRFATEYAERQQVRDLQQQNQVNITLAATIGDMEVRQKQEIVEKAVFGKGNLIVQQFDQDEEILRRYRTELGKGKDSWDLEFMQQFKDVYRPAMLERARLAKQEMARLLPGIYRTTAQRNSPEYARSQAMVQDVMDMIDLHVAALNTEDRDAADIAQAATRRTMYEMRRDNRPLDNFMAIWDPRMEGVGAAIDVIGKLDLTGAAVNYRNVVGGVGLKAVADAFQGLDRADVMTEVFIGSGQGRVVDNMDPNTIRNTLKGNWSGTEGFYGIANQSDKDNKKRALAHLELLHQNALDAAASKSPHAVGLFMTNATNALDVMTALGNVGKDQIDAAADILSDPAIFNAALTEGNGKNKNRRVALGDAAQDFASVANLPGRLQAAQAELQTTQFLGQPLIAFISFEPTTDTPTKDTQYKAVIRKDFLRQQANAYITTGSALPDAQIQMYERQLRAKINPSVDTINALVRTSAHIEALQQPTVDQYSVDYVNAYDQLGVLDFFYANGS